MTTTSVNLVSHICDVWESGAKTRPVPEAIGCTSALVLPGASGVPRFCFVSAASPLELLLGEQTTAHDRTGAALSITEVADRLMAGEVAGVLGPRGPVSIDNDRAGVAVPLPAALLEHRQRVRQDNVLARFLLRQIGLEEVSVHRGAASNLYDSLAKLWSRELSICIDPAMLLTLGADRQRHVDDEYKSRARERLPRALGRLHGLGVQSYPRLVII